VRTFSQRLTPADVAFMAENRQEINVSQVELDSIRSRLELLNRAGYPLGEAFRKAFANSLRDRLKLDPPVTDPFADHPDKEKIDTTLVKWVIGEINDDIALAQLMPLAVHYDYGDLDEDDRDLTPAQRFNFTFAKMVTDAWYTVLLQAPDKLRETFDNDYDSVGFERDFGTNKEAFADRYRGKNSCHSNPR
jgi:hypothetical protein